MAPINVSKHILIVDDESEIREILSKVILSLEGFHVSLAGNGEEALDLLKKHPVDLIITDIAMPKMNGFEFLRRLKVLGLHIPIVVITGQGDQGVSHLLGPYGVKYFLNKPWNNNELISIIKNLLLLEIKKDSAS